MSDPQQTDARLILDTESQRRAVERNQRAAANAKQHEASRQQVVDKGLTIEELPDDADEQKSVEKRQNE
jgi:hypothetical protein